MLPEAQLIAVHVCLYLTALVTVALLGVGVVYVIAVDMVATCAGLEFLSPWVLALARLGTHPGFELS